jgi:hypothetical protein
MLAQGGQTLQADAEAEFDRQLATLATKGYPPAMEAGRLRSRLAAMSQAGADVPFVVVPAAGGLVYEEAMARIELRGKSGFMDMTGADIPAFRPIEGVDIPDGPYLLLDVDTGRSTLNVPPEEALKTIVSGGRSPLTIEEGIAVVTHYPELLKTHNAFSLLGSRSGDRRVPAIWVSGGRPRLGWCWAGNPHTWLGSASCGGRRGAWPAGETGPFGP